MLRESDPRSKARLLSDWFHQKPPETRALFDHFVREYKRVGKVAVRSAKNMIIITTPRKGRAYIVPRQNYVDVVFPFKRAYPDNLCFQKIKKGPAGSRDFNHYLRMVHQEDVNKEVKKFMKLAYDLGC